VAEGQTKKDVWDRTTALAAVLIPGAIALAGHFIGRGIQAAEMANQERRSELDRARARDSLRVAQASLINTLEKSVTSGNPQERKLAVQAVLIALPDEGPALARTLAQTDEDKGVQAAATRSIDQRIETLMRDIFGDDATTRKQAAQQLVSSWRGDSNVVAIMVDFALANFSNDNGIYNTAVVLADFSNEALTANRAKVIAFAERTKSKGPKTAETANRLLSVLGGPG
jgi:hypothetical protein